MKGTRREQTGFPLCGCVCIYTCGIVEAPKSEDKEASDAGMWEAEEAPDFRTAAAKTNNNNSVITIQAYKYNSQCS